MIVALILAITLVFDWCSRSVRERGWREVSYRGHTRYVAISDSGGACLRAEADGQNSALFHPLPGNLAGATLEWRWRVLRHPSGADTERRAKDDRAAAVFVLVHRSALPWRTRGLLYQWSPGRERERWTPSPYAHDIKVITLENALASDEWRTERRDLDADLRAAFANVPRHLEAIGLLCDADNTGDRAIADFGEIRVTARGDSATQAR